MASKKIKGITIELDGNTTKLNKALDGANRTTRSLQGELREVDRLMKLDPKNVELVAQKQKILSDAVDESRKKLDTLKEAQRQVNDQFARGEIGEDQYRAVQREVVKAENELKYLEDRLKSVNDKWAATGDKMKAFGDKTTNLGKKMLPATAAIGALGGAAVFQASELEATEAKYEAVFGEFSNLADGYIDDLQKLTPVTKAEARNIASGMQDLLVPMGFARDAATDMTGELLHVTGALANFNSGTETAESVATKINAALTGEYSSLKSLGIQLDVNTVKQKAVEKGLASSTKEVTKQMMAQIALDEIYAQSGDALSAYNEASLDTKTKSALAQKQLADLGATFGEILLPAITQLVDMARETLTWLNGMDENTRKLVVTIALLVAAIGPVLIVVGKMATGIGSIIKLVGVVGPAIAGLSAPILIAIAAITAVIAIGVLLYKNWDEIKAFAKSLGEALAKTFKGIRDAIVNFFSGALEGIENIWSSIVSFFSSIPEKMAGFGRNLVQGLIDGILGMVEKAKETVGNLGSAITGGFKKVLGINSPSKVFEEFGKYTGEGFINGIEGTKKAIQDATSDIGRSSVGAATGARKEEFSGMMRIQIEGSGVKDLPPGGVNKLVDVVEKALTGRIQKDDRRIANRVSLASLRG